MRGAPPGLQLGGHPGPVLGRRTAPTLGARGPPRAPRMHLDSCHKAEAGGAVHGMPPHHGPRSFAAFAPEGNCFGAILSHADRLGLSIHPFRVRSFRVRRGSPRLSFEGIRRKGGPGRGRMGRQAAKGRGMVREQPPPTISSPSRDFRGPKMVASRFLCARLRHPFSPNPHVHIPS